MIALLSQTTSDSSASYALTRDGQTLCTAEAPFSMTAHEITLLRQQNVWLKIVPNLRDSFDKRGRGGAWQTTPCDILDAGGAKVGTMVKVREGTFFSAHYYTELQLGGRTLRIYEVGLGKEGMCYPIYEKDVLLAQVEKDPVVLDNLDAYSLCSLDEFGALAALLFALFLDFHSYRHAGERTRGKKEFRYVYTRRKEILAKYDPDFRARCETHV